MATSMLWISLRMLSVHLGTTDLKGGNFVLMGSFTARNRIISFPLSAHSLMLFPSAPCYNSEFSFAPFCFSSLMDSLCLHLWLLGLLPCNMPRERGRSQCGPIYYRNLASCRRPPYPSSSVFGPFPSPTSPSAEAHNTEVDNHEEEVWGYAIIEEEISPAPTLDNVISLELPPEGNAQPKEHICKLVCPRLATIFRLEKKMSTSRKTTTPPMVSLRKHLQLIFDIRRDIVDQ
jgi:hypothetical protein